MKTSGLWPTWGRNLVLVLGSLGVVSLVLEAAVRVGVHPTDVPRHRADPLVGYALEPAQSGVWKVGEVRSRYSINEQGYNNEHEYVAGRTPGRLRVAILGDSFVEAFQVPPGLRFFDLLEHDLASDGLDVEIYTFAVSGYGTGQQLLILERDVANYQPDLVMTVFVRNDVSDTACALGPWPVKTCFSRTADGALGHRDAKPHRPNRLGRLALRSALGRYFLIQRKLLDRVRSGPGQSPAVSPIYRTKVSAEWEEGWWVVEACLARMAAFCRARGMRFLVIHQPLVDEGTRAGAIRAGEPIDFDLPGQRLAEAAERARFEFVDLTRQLERAAVASSEPLLLENEGHWSRAGHRSVADALRPLLRDALATAQGPR